MMRASLTMPDPKAVRGRTRRQRPCQPAKNSSSLPVPEAQLMSERRGRDSGLLLRSRREPRAEPELCALARVGRSWCPRVVPSTELLLDLRAVVPLCHRRRRHHRRSRRRTPLPSVHCAQHLGVSHRAAQTAVDHLEWTVPAHCARRTPGSAQLTGGARARERSTRLTACACPTQTRAPSCHPRSVIHPARQMPAGRPARERDQNRLSTPLSLAFHWDRRAYARVKELDEAVVRVSWRRDDRANVAVAPKARVELLVQHLSARVGDGHQERALRTFIDRQKTCHQNGVRAWRAPGSSSCRTASSCQCREGASSGRRSCAR